jgi:hypothetical protein
MFGKLLERVGNFTTEQTRVLLENISPDKIMLAIRRIPGFPLECNRKISSIKLANNTRLTSTSQVQQTGKLQFQRQKKLRQSPPPQTQVLLLQSEENVANAKANAVAKAEVANAAAKVAAETETKNAEQRARNAEKNARNAAAVLQEKVEANAELQAIVAQTQPGLSQYERAQQIFNANKSARDKFPVYSFNRHKPEHTLFDQAKKQAKKQAQATPTTGGKKKSKKSKK